MNIFKQWYLRLFRGWIKTDTAGKHLIRVCMFYDRRHIEYVDLGNGSWLISPPRKRSE